MRNITLTADDGEQLLGKLPDSWAEVPLLPYAQLVSATTLPTRIEATATLVGLPAAPLVNDVSLFMHLVHNAPWLFNELPPEGEPVTEFRHEGTRYVSQGALAKLTAGQLEALYTLQQVHAEAPVLAAPALLAVLYNPEGAKHTPEMYQATGAAFATLPLSVAWPALQDFIRSSGPRSASILFASALSAQLTGALTSLESSLTSGVYGTFFSRPLRWLARTWIQSVRKTV